jgi:uncharacterized LabA/DUF88 family protein
MLNTTQSLLSLTIATGISLFGVFTQQSSLIGAGAGLAGGIGSTKLVRSRHKDSKPTEIENARFQTISRGLSAVVEKGNLQEDKIQQLSKDSITLQQLIAQLNQQVQTQQTQLRLQTQSIQKVQKINHEHCASIAAKNQEIDRLASLATAKNQELASLISAQEKNKVTPRLATTHFLVDGNAARFVEKNLGKEIDYEGLRASLTQGADNVESRFYIGRAGSSKHKRLVQNLQALEFEVLQFPIVNVGSKITVKGDDVKMALDATLNVSPGDSVILILGGDGDFVPVIQTLKAKNINFTVVSYLKNTSHLLKQAAGNNLVDLESLICAKSTSA